MFSIPLQFILLSATSAGWAYWLKRYLKIETPWTFSLATLLFGAGFAVQILLLQNLVYFNLPVASTFALPAAIGLYGLYQLIRDVPPLDPADRNRAAGLLIGVFLLQASTAIFESPTFYYGKGHTDQYNYVIMSQFVLTEPFNSAPADIHMQPWLTRAHEFKQWRIGQAVAQAYTAAMSFTNAKEAYGGLSSFCIALIALFTYALARSMAIPRNLALLAGTWAGFAPALTRYNVEGFLSQAATIFILPFLALWARTRTRQPGYAIGLPAIALSYLLVCYVELLPVGLVVFGALALYRAFRSSMATLVQSAAAVGVSLVLVPYALATSYTFLMIQMQRASDRFPLLEAQAGLAGTIPGWIQGLAAFPFLAYPLQVLTALLLVALTAGGIYKSSRRNRLFYAAILAPPILLLGYLLVQTPLAKYPFSKIQDSFAYLWILAPLAGLSRLRTLLRGRVNPAVILAVPGFFLIFAAIGTYNHDEPIFTHAGILQSLQSPDMVKAIEYAESHDKQTYLVKTPNPYAAAWLAYHARNSKTFLSPPRLADFSLKRNEFEFTKVPDYVPGMILLSTSGVHSQGTSGGAPTMEIFNPQGEERDATDVWYWLGDTMDLEVNRWDDDSRPVQYDLKVRVDPGPSNPSVYRKMRLTNSRTGLGTVFETNAGQTPSVPIILAPGRNPLFLELLEPTQATVTVPHDPRKLMVRLINPVLTNPKPIDKPDPALVRAIASGVPKTPAIRVINPQGEDTSGASSWFWVQKRIDIELTRTDADPGDYLYQLSFLAESGFANPNPLRTLRLIHKETGTETILKVTGRAMQSLSLNLKPGENHVSLEIVEDLPQTVKAPGDPRVHMLRVEDFGLRPIRPNAGDAAEKAGKK